MTVNSDSERQQQLLHSMPWAARLHFRDAMASTVGYTEKLANGGNGQIPLAQRICLMKANEKTKARAMAKLREVKAKSEDSGSKARQYLDGLLRIPFGIYRNEDILSTCGQTEELIKDIEQSLAVCGLPRGDLPQAYTAADAYACVALCRSTKLPAIQQEIHTKLAKAFISCKRSSVLARVKAFNERARRDGIKQKLLHSGRSLRNIEMQLQEHLAHPNVADVIVAILGDSNSQIRVLCKKAKPESPHASTP